MKRIMAVLIMGTLTAGLAACDGQQVTPAEVEGAAARMITAIANSGKPQGVQVGWTYAQVVAFQGKPQRIYGHGTPVMVYPLPNNLQQKIGIDGLDNQSKVLWVGTFNAMNQQVKT